jgi:hypothetical protein
MLFATMEKMHEKVGLETCMTEVVCMLYNQALEKCDDPILAHLTPYPDQDTACHQGGGDLALAI